MIIRQNIDIDLKPYRFFEKESIGEQYETVVDELKELGVNDIGTEVDISNQEQVQTAIQKIMNNLGKWIF